MRLGRFSGWPVLFLIAGLWELLAHTDPSPFIPSLERIGRSAFDLTASGDLGLHVRATLTRVIAGLFFGSLAGLATGILLATSPTSSRLAQGTLTFLRHTPIFGLVPLISLWFGTQDLAKIVLISIAAYFPVMLQTQEGIRNTPARYLELARALTFNRRQTLRRVLLPSAAPFIGTGLRQASAFAWISGVGVELFMNTGAGLGSLLTAARISFRMDYIVIGIVVIAVIGAIMNEIGKRAEAVFV